MVRRFVVAIAPLTAVALGACPSPYGASESPDVFVPTDAYGDAQDAGLVDTATAMSDAADAAATRCNPSASFANQPLKDLTASPYGLTLSADELTVYFGASGVGGDYRIFTAGRSTRSAAFGPASLVAELVPPSKGSFREPNLSADALTLYFTYLPAAGGSQLLQATRPGTTVGFKSYGDISAELKSADIEEHANITGDGLELYFDKYPGPVGREDMFVATRQSPADVFGSVRQVAELNTPDVDKAPAIRADGLEIYFARTIADGSIRIHVAKRTSRKAPFGAPAPVPQLKGTGNYELPTWVSADGCILYYISGSGTGTTSMRVASKGAQ